MSSAREQTLRNGEPPELLAEYALGTLEPAEGPRVEAYLARSERARAELRTLRRSLVSLTEALPPAAAPPETWAKISAGISAGVTAIETSHPSAPPPTLETTQDHPPPAHRPGQHQLGWWLAACFCLLAVGELVWGVRTQQALRQVTADERLITSFLAEPTVGRAALQGPGGEALGSVLIEPEGKALFVMARPPAAGRVYQAWGHRSDDWTPGSGEQLTSLSVAENNVFTASPSGFSALYLSLEPAGGSVQPTAPLAHVALGDPLPNAPLEISSPENGQTLTADSVIVSGLVQNTVTALSYRLNGGEPRATSASGTRFTFTVTGLQAGDNTVAVTATLSGRQVTEEVTVRYAP